MASSGRSYQYLKPSEIRYTQDSISSRFSKSKKTLQETLQSLLRKGIPKRDVPMIRVVQRNGKWWSFDNRRLWVFKELEKEGGCKIIKVEVVPIDENEWRKKFTTQNDGTSVRIRGRLISVSSVMLNYLTFYRL